MTVILSLWSISANAQSTLLSNVSRVNNTTQKQQGHAILPIVTIASPSKNSTLPIGAPLVTGNASAGLGGNAIKFVKVHVDKQAYSTASPKIIGDWSNWFIKVNISTPGPHVIQARATDIAGNQNWYTLSVNTGSANVNTSSIPASSNKTASSTSYQRNSSSTSYQRNSSSTSYQRNSSSNLLPTQQQQYSYQRNSSSTSYATEHTLPTQQQQVPPTNQQQYSYQRNSDSTSYQRNSNSTPTNATGAVPPTNATAAVLLPTQQQQYLLPTQTATVPPTTNANKTAAVPPTTSNKTGSRPPTTSNKTAAYSYHK